MLSVEVYDALTFSFGDMVMEEFTSPQSPSTSAEVITITFLIHLQFEPDLSPYEDDNKSKKDKRGDITPLLAQS